MPTLPMPEDASQPPHYVRHVDARLRDALTDTRIVALVGPRQSGKTTLARKISQEKAMTYVTLDDEQFRQFAMDDPGGFVRDLEFAVIDEIQRAPGLILALKKTVDEDPRPGRFLITGSVNLFRGTLSPDSLAGRVETIELLPLSQSEIEHRSAPTFLRRAFSADFPALQDVGRTSDLIERLCAGGYPEALTRSSELRRQAWLKAYAHSLATRDVAEIAGISKTAELARLLDHAAVASGQTVNLTALATPLGVDAKTIDRWLDLLEQMFVIRRIPAWHRNDLKRLVKTPRLHFLDSGLLAALRRQSVASLRSNRTMLGGILEGFAFTELAKLASLEIDPVQISHYRDRDQVEVDIVLERAGEVVGVEIKAATSVKPEDFDGLKRLRDMNGDAFALGVILHDGDRIQRTGDRLVAMPFNQLWT